MQLLIMTPFVFLLALLASTNVVAPVALGTAPRWETRDPQQDVTGNKLEVTVEPKETQVTADGIEEANGKRFVRDARKNVAAQVIENASTEIAQLKTEISNLKLQLKVAEMNQSFCNPVTESVSAGKLAPTEYTELIDTITPASTEPTNPAYPTEEVTTTKMPENTSTSPTANRQSCLGFVDVINGKVDIIKNLTADIKTLKTEKTGVDHDLRLANENLVKERLKTEQLESEVADLKRNHTQKTALISETEHKKKISSLKNECAIDVKFYEDKILSMNAIRDEVSSRLKTVSNQHEDCEKRFLVLQTSTISINQSLAETVEELEAKIEALEAIKSERNECVNKLSGLEEKNEKLTMDLKDVTLEIGNMTEKMTKMVDDSAKQTAKFLNLNSNWLELKKASTKCNITSG